MKDVNIYGLIDPRTGAVFYVGKTIRLLSTRLNVHICDALAFRRCSSGPLVRDIVEAGMRPLTILLEVVPTDGWSQAEKRWIIFYRSLGALSNRTAGGEGVSFRTPEWSRKIVQSGVDSGRRADGNKQAADKVRGRKASDATRRKMSAAKKGRPATVAEIERMGALYRGKKWMPSAPSFAATYGAAKSKARCIARRSVRPWFVIERYTAPRKPIAGKIRNTAKKWWLQ